MWPISGISAAAIAAVAGCAVETDGRLLELDYGEWDGKPLAELLDEFVFRGVLVGLELDVPVPLHADAASLACHRDARGPGLRPKADRCRQRDADKTGNRIDFGCASQGSPPESLACCRARPAPAHGRLDEPVAVRFVPRR